VSEPGGRGRRRGGLLWPILALPGIVWLCLFFLVPFYVVLGVAFGTVDPLFLTPQPEWNPARWDPQAFEFVWEGLAAGGGFRTVFVRTFAYVAIAVVISLAIAYPVAYWISRYGGRRKVLLLVLVTYVLTSLLDNDSWSAVILVTATSVTSVVALVSSHARERFVRMAISLSLLTVLLATIGAAADARTWLNLASLIQVSLLTLAMGAVLRRVVSAPEVGSRTILGALSVYTVLGILFTFVYGTVDRIQGGPFFEGLPDPSGTDFIFFSYTTLTTTGYGNLVPGGQPGQLISGLEMMAGQIFLVTLVAGLVSLWRPGEGIRRHRERRGEG